MNEGVLDPAETEDMRCGLVAIVGRPNVGKTTLMNHLVGEKLAAVTRKPHTTRHRIIGIVTEDQDQMVLIDTPGFDRDPRRLLNRMLNRNAELALAEADIIVFLMEAGRVHPDDELILQRIKETGKPVILALNKVDRVANKELLLAFIAERTREFAYQAIVPISAQTGRNLLALLGEIRSLLPQAPFLYDPDQLTDRPQRFRAEELIREALVERLGEELPYVVAVLVESWEDRPRTTHIDAVIWVERESQKGIVIGKGGHVLQSAGRAAREQLELLLERPVMLRLTVRVKSGWSRDERMLQKLGIDRQG